jgi:CHAD domain-containing protein
VGKARKLTDINCDASALAGLRKALKERLDEMLDLRHAASDGKDADAVHDIRVASRRLRSALEDSMPYLKDKALNSTVKHLKSIADALGDVRDQDVAIPALEKLGSRAEPEILPTIQDLIRSRKKIRKGARRSLKKQLKDDLEKVSSDFETALTPSKRKHSGANGGNPSYSTMASQIIQKRLRNLEKLSKGMYTPGTSEALHDMRIGAKRLRYAIELFNGCWQSDSLRYAKKIAKLQSALGQVHDCDVWIESLEEQLQEAKESEKTDETKAYTWLLNHFIKLRNRHLSLAFRLWRAWESNGLSDQLKSLIATRHVATPQPTAEI